MRPTRIIFCDIDGVLCSDDYLRVVGPKALMSSWDEAIDRDAIARLNAIFALTGAKVVVSSDWRREGRALLPRVKFADLFARRGFRGDVIGVTPVLAGDPPRGREIQAWLTRYDARVDSFVILDDQDDMVSLRHRLVRTTLKEGLQDHHVALAVRMLRERVRMRRSA